MGDLTVAYQAYLDRQALMKSPANQKILKALREKKRRDAKLKEASTTLAALYGTRKFNREPIKFAVTVQVDRPAGQTKGPARSEVALLVNAELINDKFVILDNLQSEEDGLMPVDELQPYAYVWHKASKLLCSAFAYRVEAEVFTYRLLNEIDPMEWPRVRDGVLIDSGVELRQQLVDMANEVESWNVCGVRATHGERVEGVEAIDDKEHKRVMLSVRSKPFKVVPTDALDKDPVQVVTMPDGSYFSIANNGSLYLFYEKINSSGYVVVEEEPNGAVNLG